MQKIQPRAERGGPVSVAERATSTDPIEFQKARARAHRAAVAKFSKNVDSLVHLLGAQLVAYIADVSETRSVRQWISGEHTPHSGVQRRVLLALQIASFLNEEGEEGAIEAWFQGLNPALDDHAPAELLRTTADDNFSKMGRQVLAAAREFVNK